VATLAIGDIHGNIEALDDPGADRRRRDQVKLPVPGIGLRLVGFTTCIIAAGS
jgi:hypothetical protein